MSISKFPCVVCGANNFGNGYGDEYAEQKTPHVIGEGYEECRECGAARTLVYFGVSGDYKVTIEQVTPRELH